VAAIARQAAVEDPKWHADALIGFDPLRDRIVGNIRPALLALPSAVLLVLLAACVVPTLRAIRVDPATALKRD
jgi:hypothetical protein